MEAPYGRLMGAAFGCPACGLVAGSALMDVLLAIPFSIFHSPDALQLVGPRWHTSSVVLGGVSTLLLAAWIERRVCRKG